MASEKKSTPKKSTQKPAEQKVVEVSKSKTAAAESSPPKGRATGFRIPAIILWVGGLVAMVFAILGILDGNSTMLFICMGVAALCCIVGALLWKKANRIRPCPVKDDGSTKNKILIFLWNQMGLVATFIIFLPIGLVLLLAGKNVPPRIKKIALAVFAILFVLAGAVSIDYDPPVEEISEGRHVDSASYELPAGAVVPAMVDLNDTAYWTQYGKSYHLPVYDEETGEQVYCSTIRHSLTIYQGIVADALEAGRLDPCDICAYGDTVKDQQQNAA